MGQVPIRLAFRCSSSLANIPQDATRIPRPDLFTILSRGMIPIYIWVSMLKAVWICLPTRARFVCSHHHIHNDDSDFTEIWDSQIHTTPLQKPTSVQPGVPESPTRVHRQHPFRRLLFDNCTLVLPLFWRSSGSTPCLVRPTCRRRSRPSLRVSYFRVQASLAGPPHHIGVRQTRCDTAITMLCSTHVVLVSPICVKVLCPYSYAPIPQR